MKKTAVAVALAAVVVAAPAAHARATTNSWGSTAPAAATYLRTHYHDVVSAACKGDVTQMHFYRRNSLGQQRAYYHHLYCGATLNTGRTVGISMWATGPSSFHISKIV
jgi:hypothetical protein